MKLGIAYALLATGFLFLALSVLWPKLFPVTISWTNEKADRAHVVKERIHNLSFIVNSPNPSMHKGQDLGKLKAEYEELKKEVDQLNADFNSAANTPKTMATTFKWSGISLAVLGLIGWYAVNQQR